MTLNIIIVNWNSSAALRRCLASIACSDFPSFRVIVVDNASSGEELRSLSSIENEYREFQVHFVRNTKNRGYAGGNNAGLQYLVDHKLDGELLILNPDAEVQPDTLRVMAAAVGEDVGIVTPRIVTPSGKVLFDWIRLIGYRQQHIIEPLGARVNTDVSQGTCMLIRRSLCENIGLFDERFFLYWEEVDLSLRARAAGYRLIAVNGTSVKKAENAASRIPPCLYYSIRNARLIRTLHPWHFSKRGYLLYLISIAALSFKLVGRPELLLKAVSSVWEGLRDGINGCYGARGSHEPS